jgi:hypothetical protein
MKSQRNTMISKALFQKALKSSLKRDRRKAAPLTPNLQPLKMKSKAKETIKSRKKKGRNQTMRNPKKLLIETRQLRKVESQVNTIP